MRQQLHCVAKAQTVCVQMGKTFEVKNTVCVETCWQQGGKQRSKSKLFWQKLQNLFDILAVLLYSTRACSKGKCPWQRTILWKWQRFAVFLKKFNVFFVERSATKHFKTKSKRKTQKKFQKFQKNIGKTVDTKGEL